MIREATAVDKPHFLRLWKEMVQHDWETGYDIIPSEETLGWYLGIFNGYVDGHRFGSCGLWYPDDSDEPQGIVMFGESSGTDDRPESKYGKIAIGWGVHLAPGYRRLGASTSLLEYIKKLAPELGFDTLVFDTIIGDDVMCKVVEYHGGVVVAKTHVITFRKEV